MGTILPTWIMFTVVRISELVHVMYEIMNIVCR